MCQLNRCTRDIKILLTICVVLWSAQLTCVQLA